MPDLVQSEKRGKYKQPIEEWRKRVEKGVIGSKDALQVKLHALNVEVVPIDTLKPNEYNPNRQSDEEFELLCASIERDGFTMPVLANRDGMIVDGEHRWLAAKKLGYEEIPVVLVDLDEVRMRIATIRHNKARGQHDADLEALVLADLERVAGRDFIVDNLKIDDDELDKVLSFSSAFDAAGDEFRDAWVPVRNEEAFQTDETGKPKASPTFSARESVDGALVVKSHTQAANTAAFHLVMAGKKGSDGRKVRDEVERVRPFTGTLPLDVAQDVVAFYEREDLHGSTPAERFFNLAAAFAKEELASDG